MRTVINCFCMFSDDQPMTLDEWIVIRSDEEVNDENSDQLFLHVQ